MLKSFIKIVFRNLRKYKNYSITNIIGLSAGLVCAIFILLWVKYELSYDKFNEKAGNICLAYLKGTQEGGESYQPTTSPIIAGILKDEFPEVVNAARMGDLGEVVFKHNDKIILEPRGMAGDPSVLDIFTFNFLKGSASTALANPNSITLTESLAKKYFGDENPLGQIVTINNKYDFTVSAVIEDIPPNAHRRYDFLVPFQFLKELGFQIEGRNFYPCNYYNYVLLRDGASYRDLSKKVSQRIGSKGKEITFQIILMPLTSVHLFETGGNQKIYMFLSIAFIIVLIACINFMNIAIAMSMKRAKEVGVRKVLGAGRKQIILQIISESMVMALLAILIAIFAVELLLPVFHGITQQPIQIDYFNLDWLIIIAGLVLVSGIISGSYPAFFLSSFQPSKVLRSGRQSLAAKSGLRKSLLIVQFSVSIIFIITTLVMNSQMKYIRNFDLGLNPKNIFYVKLEGDITQKIQEVKTELLKNPNIMFVASSSRLPVAIRSGSYRKWGKMDDRSRRISEVYVDYDYLKAFGLQMAEGRFFSEEHQTDATDAIVVNHAAIKKLGTEAAIDQPFYYDTRNYNLLGVMKDFQNISPMFTAPTPLAFFVRPEGNQYLFAKIDPRVSDIHAIAQTTNYIRKVCDKFSPAYPLHYSFLSDYSYQEEVLVGIRQKLILYSTFLAILISCLGLLGLSAFINEQRTKEIGIRKVVGATTADLMMMLTRDFAKWILAANLIAWPVAWFVMHKWLQNFAFRIEITWWIFALAGGLALVIALLTVSTQAIKAAMGNPVESLRYE